MAPRNQKARLTWPLTAAQVEDLDEMIQTLFEDAANGSGLPLTNDGDLLYFEDGELRRLAIGAASLVLTSNGTIPVWGQVSLTAGVTGILPVANGGMGAASHTAYALLAGGVTAAAAVQSLAGVGTAGQVLTSNGAGALPTFQVSAAAAASGYWSPLTNGDPLNPELIFDGDGDSIAVLLPL